MASIGTNTAGVGAQGAGGRAGSGGGVEVRLVAPVGRDEAACRSLAAETERDNVLR